ncbi:MAG: redox-regulated ATPase YchF [Candidatus Coatesbacteria bacterium]|nr:MAG: redox-regulated ATPase YchF [Candidatus Coatesbacteria bacterium]
MDIGLVGLPNAGKTTLFNVLTGCEAEVGCYPFTTVESNVATLPVPDPRLDKLSELVSAVEVRPAHVKVVDIAGLVEGAHAGEGLGNRFLAHIREMDAVIYVLRLFADDEVAPAGRKELPDAPDPEGDLAVLNTELLLADIATVEKRLDKVRRKAKGQKDEPEELNVLEELLPGLAEGALTRCLPLGDTARGIIGELFLLTAKPALYVANRGAPDDVGETRGAKAVAAAADRDGAVPLDVYCGLEAELADLPDDEAAAFREELGIGPPARERVLGTAAGLLDLVTFYTVENDIISAFRVPGGTPAKTAAGKIHSDLAEKFIKTEVVSYDDLTELGSIQAARDRGLVRTEGPAYVVQDADIMKVKHG